VATFHAQDVELLLGLDGDAVVFLTEFADERTVDLDLVERKAAKIAERGMMPSKRNENMANDLILLP
jgi:hypothetical protein